MSFFLCVFIFYYCIYLVMSGRIIVRLCDIASLDDCHRLARGLHVAIGWDLWHWQASASGTASYVLVQISRLQCRKGRPPVSLSLRLTPERHYYRSIILSPCYGQLPTDPVAAAANKWRSPLLTNVLLLKPGVCQNIAMRALIAYCQEFLPCLNFDLPGTFTFIF